MVHEEYSLYKLVHYPEIIRRIKSGVQPPPIQAHLIVTNRCNQNCLICAYRRTGYQSNQNFRPSDELSHDKVMEILGDFVAVGAKAVQFTGGGEPLLHPDIVSILAGARRLGLKVALVTNGVLLSDDVVDAAAGASWIRISLDAATAATYAKVKRSSPNSFDAVIRNIEKLIKHKGDTVVGIGFVVQEHNYHEILAAASLARNLGVDNIRISAAFTPAGIFYFSAFEAEAREQAALASELSTDEFRVFNLFNERIGELFSGAQAYEYCHYKDLVPYIGADGKVYSCCAKSYTDQGLMGDIRESSFKDFWQGPDKQKRYKLHDPRLVCRHPCMFEKKNQFLGYCALADPRHVEFV